jgi:hydroxymethylpyrimidine/phosphomethylpyrimidine kinase
MKKYNTVLTIAGSDSGGGAGIQADLKTFSACGCFGTSAITAITAQNTCGVTDIHPVPIATLEAQIRAVLDDIGADAIKLGMLHSSRVIECVAGLLAEYQIENVVLDPVMVATSGARLIQEDAIAALQELLFPRVRLITPNIPEAEILRGQAIAGDDSVREYAAQLGAQFQLSVLAKGGHLDQTILEDALYDHETSQMHIFKSPKIATQNSHGTGCTLSSSLAAYLARGLSLLKATEQALDYVHRAIATGAHYQIGRGQGPVHHFHAFWD